MGPLYAHVGSYPAPAADPAVLVVGAPPRGMIRTFRLMSVGTPPTAFTYALYSSLLAFVPDASGRPTPVLSANAELYRVTPDVTVTGAAIAAGGFDLTHAYQNQDGGPSTRKSSLYLRVSGAGTANPLASTITVETSNLF